MDESDEDKVLLEDDSMDEVHELDDDLMASIDTNASPAKTSMTNSRRWHDDDGSDEGKHDDSDESELFDGSNSSSDESESSHSGDKAGEKKVPVSSSHVHRTGEPVARMSGEAKRDEDYDEDNDEEPPEIPGSPLRVMSGTELAGSESALARGEHGVSRQKPSPSADILMIRHDSSESENGEDYETKEIEAPRAMELHTSSSSSESEVEESDSDGDNNNHRQRSRKPANTNHGVHHERPKTAAKELALYRGVVPTEYFEQIVQDAPSSPKKHGQEAATSAAAARGENREQGRPREAAPRTTSAASQSETTKYKLRVPREIEDLFKYVDLFSPDEMDIPTRLQPFIPEYVPTVGLPFDGIQIPRPDNKHDAAGIAFVREPCAQSNIAELELLLATQTKKQKRKRQMESVERVHSIEDACHRPREIDNWIASVVKVQATRALPQVHYKKPMPSETSLMELWPEEFEIFLTKHPPIPLSKMDLTLTEMIRVVCGVLDIPVYDGLQIHSLHALFSLYHEVVTYEKELLGQVREDAR